jgi:hypothetical protein
MRRLSAFLLLAAALLAAACAERPAEDPPARSAAPAEAVEATLAMNRAFRERYAETRERLRGDVEAVLLVSGARMVLRQKGEPEWAKFYGKAIIDQYKVVTHVPLGVYVMTAPYADGPASDELRDKAAAYRERARAFAAILGQLEIPVSQMPRQRLMVDGSLALLDRLVADGTVSKRELDAFARRMGPPQLINADLAAAAQLDSLHAATAEMRARLKPGQWEKLYVLVMGSKMPRGGNIVYEYFVRVLGRSEIERRLLYTEGLTTPDTAAPLVGTVVIDRDAAQAFFGDRYRLDRDLLGDGARKHLDQMFRN